MTRPWRALLAALALVNLLYFIWTQGGLAWLGTQPASFSEREPQRMAQQLRPDALQIRKEPPPADADAALSSGGVVEDTGQR